jgi:YjbR
VKPDQFRRIALALEGAVEGAHMSHPDFRVNNRIFASLHSKDQFGMVKLTPEQQSELIENHPDMFEPESGAWGRSGCTRVKLKLADEEAVGEAMTLAWRNTRKVQRRKKCR